jgi:hypothetical protein
VPDEVRLIRTYLFEKPFEVVHGWPRWTLVAARDHQATSHVRAACFPIMAIVMAGRGHSPLKALLVPLVGAFYTLLGAVGGDIGWRLLLAARGCLPASLCGAKHDRLVAGSALGGDAMRLLEHASEEVAMSALSRALRAMFGQRACATLTSLAVNLGFVASLLPLSYWGLG